MVIVVEVPEAAVLLIHRRDTLTYHAGQIACPGGSYDPRLDRSLWDTAVRETREEVGIAITRRFFCGFLDPVHIVVTGFTIAPAVAVMPTPPAIILDQGEVSSYQWVSLAELRQVRRMSRVLLGGASYRMPEFPLHWGRLWGATARIIDQLLRVVDDSGQHNGNVGEEEVGGGNPQTFSH
ncbi:MAG: CoA pyrophosphatase [Sulfobacillus acidophilus]|uniref:CoA pyrophosphatase n=1 Tax=Sulfobacillus acidophilus TaxID=53633 RepID=A0A2T2WJB1_9FIRM|nr:MAG: CoA pyrophosphatase [Sulfobacillus acidophilus]